MATVGAPPPATRLEGHRDSVNTVFVSPHDPGLVVTGSDDKSVRLWRLTAGRGASCVATLLGAPDAVAAVAVDAARPGRVWGAAGCRLLAWDTDSAAPAGAVVAAPALSKLHASDDIAAVGAHPLLPTVVTVDDDGCVGFVNSASGALAAIARRAHASLAPALALRPPLSPALADALLLRCGGAEVAVDAATGGLDNTVLFWAAARARAVGAYDTRTGEFGGAAAGSGLDRRKAAAGGGGGSGGGRRGAARGAAGSALAGGGGRGGAAAAGAANKPGGGTAAAGAAPSAAPASAPPDDGNSTAASTGNASTTGGGGGGGAGGGNQLVNPPFVHAAAWSPDGAVLAVALGSGAVTLLQPETRAVVADLPDAHASAAVAVAWVRVRAALPASSAADAAADGDAVDGGSNSLPSALRTHLVSAGNDGMLCEWDVDDVLHGVASGAATPPPPQLVRRWKHGTTCRGPNWIAAVDAAAAAAAAPVDGSSGGWGLAGGALLVADVRKAATVYWL